ncbi:MAG: nucleotidyltransferase domain-containing protein [Proteiniphilum sp.]
MKAFTPTPAYTGEIPALIKQYVHDIDDKAKIWLFGSRARNQAGGDSDWDVLILTESEKVSHQEEAKFIDHLSTLMVETGQVIQVMVYSEQEWNTKYSVIPLYKSIKRDGLLL